MTCQGISLGLVSIGCCFSFLSLEGGFYLFFTRSVSEVTGFFFVPNFRIFEFFSSHGLSRKVMDFFVPIFFLVPNFRISELFLHTENRGVSRFFLFTRLVLGPTDRREVIAEFLSITRSVADGCGACSSCEWGTIRRCL